MKLVKTFGRGKATADALIEALEHRGAVSTARVEPVVSRILADVRKSGDWALLKYAAEFDGLVKGQALLVSPEEMKAAWEGTAPELQAAMMVARANILEFAEAQRPAEWMISPVDGVKTGQIVRPLESVGCYVPGAVSAAFDAADDGDAGAGCGGGTDCRVLAEACEGDDGSGVAGGCDGVLSCGWSAGDWRDGLWDGHGWAREQNCWAGKFVCYGREDYGVG